MEKRKKRKRYIWLAIGLLVVSVLAINFFRTHWVQSFLAHKLIERTSEETDGFYKLSYEKLTISFLNGELKIKGVRLTPDSTVFADWAAKDSLPTTYLDLYIDLIHFKGLNLTWRHNFKKLHFKAFEIKKPNIKIYQTAETIRPEKKHHHAASQNIYQMISRYIEVLSVNQLNLDNASVLFTALNPKSPITYALQNVSFDAFGFCLDQQTYENGKLLFCDNFSFTTNQPQQLLSNNDFNLYTDSISLSTQDSLIYIGNIRLNSNRTNPGFPENSFDAGVKEVLVNGIKFERKDALSYLTIRSFDISHPEIAASHLVEKEENEASPKKADDLASNELEQPISIYDIVSPILHKLVVNELDIDKAKMQYTLYSDKGKDHFQIDAFSFKVFDVVIDSVAMSNDQYLFSQNFDIDITGLLGEMESSNHRVKIKDVELSSTKETLKLNDVQLRPIHTNGANDYVVANIDLIELSGLTYKNGVDFHSFEIINPEVKYTIVPKADNTKKRADKAEKKKTKSLALKGIFSPLMQHLSLKELRITNAGFIVADKRSPQGVDYRLENFNFLATNLLLKESDKSLTGYAFSYGKAGFSFTDFDNLLPGSEYRLSISKGSYSTASELFSLSNILLLPQDTLFQNSNSYIQFQSPQLNIAGLDARTDKNKGDVSFKQLNLVSPQAELKEKSGAHYALNLEGLVIDSMFWSKQLFSIGQVNINTPLVDAYTLLKEKVEEKPKPKEHKPFKFPSIALPDTLYHNLSSIAERLALGRFAINDARINFTAQGKDTVIKMKIDTTSLALSNIEIDTRKRSFSWGAPYFSTCNLSYPINHGLFNIGVKSIRLMDDSLYIGGISYTSPYSKMEFSYADPKHRSWYDITLDYIAISGLDISNILSTEQVKLKSITIEKPTLQNFVNAKTKLPRHKYFPLLYTYLQKAPIAIDIPVVYVNDFTVIYQELSKKGTVLGTLSLDDMTGTISNITNVYNPSHPYMVADLNGLLMENGKFHVVWDIPIDSLNDNFRLSVEVDEFDLREMNRLVSPLAPLEVKSGQLSKLTMTAEASSQKAKADMLMQYDNLHAEIIHYKDTTVVENKFASVIADKLLKHENKDRHAIIEIERDPYHPTFNYIWQILEPALIESIGFSEKTQEKAIHAIGFLERVKRFFCPKSKSEPLNYPDLILPTDSK